MGDSELHFGQYGDTIARLRARDLAATPRPEDHYSEHFVGVKIHNLYLKLHELVVDCFSFL